MSKDGDVRPGPEDGDRASFLTDSLLYRTTLKDLPDQICRWRPDGAKYRVRWTNRALVNESGAVTDCGSIWQDFTDRHYGEQAPCDAEARLRGIIEAEADGTRHPDLPTPFGETTDMTGERR